MRPSLYCASPSWGLTAAASSMRRKCWRLRMPAPRLENSPARKYHAKKIKKGDAIQRIRKSAGTHKKAAAANGIQERQTTPAAAPLPAPNTVRTPKNISTPKYRQAIAAITWKTGRGAVHAATISGTQAAANAIAPQVSSGE